jgi:hypothetical protein
MWEATLQEQRQPRCLLVTLLLLVLVLVPR